MTVGYTADDESDADFTIYDVAEWRPGTDPLWNRVSQSQSNRERAEVRFTSPHTGARPTYMTSQVDW